MITRRTIIAAACAAPLCLQSSLASSAEEISPFDQLIYPPIESLDDPEVFGYSPPTQAQRDKAREIVAATKRGPTPVDIAQSVVDRFFKQDPEAISQWPAPAAWNPLIVEFFSATTYKANNDMVAWCAAFANWCIERSGRNGSRSAASQSFLSDQFKATSEPKPGDLAVFTCYDLSTGRSLGLGHVTFFKEKLPNNFIRAVGGNQSGDGHSSIISESTFITTDRRVRRHIGNNYVPCTMRLNTYISIV